MARGKKKESALTPEEKLAQALVPEGEQPYQVPENWCWARIGAISDFERGITFPASAKESELTEDNIPCLRTANVQEDLELDDLIYVNRNFIKGNDAKLVRENDIIMSSANSRELVGKSSLVTHVPFPMTFGGFVLNIRAKGIASKYLFYFLRQEFLAGKFMGESTQTTNIANINTTTLGSYELPLPPLEEQERIVDRIEYLFAKLDEAKEKAQSVLDSFETRKAAILHKAFTGELTAKWRAEHGVHVHPGNYPLIEVYNFIDYRGVTPDKTSSGVPLITAKNIKKGYIDYRVSEYISHETYLQRLGRGIARRNDLLFTTEAPLGNVALADQDTYSTAQRVIVLQLREEFLNKVNNKYVMYHMLDEKFQTQLQDQKTGSTVAGIKAAKLKLIPIVLPSADEQEEVVRILDSLFAKEQQAKEAVEAVLEKIDLLKKSILARAFRGELGTNDPTEESTMELLKTIL